MYVPHCNIGPTLFPKKRYVVCPPRKNVFNLAVPNESASCSMVTLISTEASTIAVKFTYLVEAGPHYQAMLSIIEWLNVKGGLIGLDLDKASHTQNHELKNKGKKGLLLLVIGIGLRPS